MGIETVFDLVELHDCCKMRINVREWVAAAFDAT